MIHFHITIVLFLNIIYLDLTAKISRDKKHIRGLLLFHLESIDRKHVNIFSGLFKKKMKTD